MKTKPTSKQAGGNSDAYWVHKGGICNLLLAIVDAKCLCLYANAGLPGSVGDMGLLMPLEHAYFQVYFCFQLFDVCESTVYNSVLTGEKVEDRLPNKVHARTDHCIKVPSYRFDIIAKNPGQDSLLVRAPVPRRCDSGRRHGESLCWVKDMFLIEWK
jgi:hypothetical protein